MLLEKQDKKYWLGILLYALYIKKKKNESFVKVKTF